MRAIRVFPRRTRATPDDELAYVGLPDFWAEADRVEISVTFSWDLRRAECLAKQWERVAPVSIGGPATGVKAGEFVPGRYLRPGYTITSRGCPNRCWFCEAWKHGGPHELPIRDGWIVQDDNLLACSDGHVRAVFAMLARQRERAVFAGGLEAASLRDWHLDLLVRLRPQPTIFFSYDQPADWEPLIEASRRLYRAGISNRGHRNRCYVLIGWPGDRLEAAEARLRETLKLGLTPSAMLYRDQTGKLPPIEWRQLQRRWMRPAIIHASRPSLLTPNP